MGEERDDQAWAQHLVGESVPPPPSPVAGATQPCYEAALVRMELPALSW